MLHHVRPWEILCKITVQTGNESEAKFKFAIHVPQKIMALHSISFSF